MGDKSAFASRVVVDEMGASSDELAPAARAVLQHPLES